jgi:uncharacterized SAM-binding protein YcdF (DUF218 family)
VLTLLRLANVLLLLSLVGCLAGALAGLAVFVPFVAGAWALNLMALAAYEERGPAPVAEPVPVPGRSRELDEAA